MACGRVRSVQKQASEKVGKHVIVIEGAGWNLGVRCLELGWALTPA
jgi:hypothetical protein